MATLTIRKKSNFTWLHIDSELGSFILSKFYTSSDNTKIQIVEQGQSRRREYEVTNVYLYDDVLNTGVETFTNITDLSLRLEALLYPAFDYENVPISMNDTNASHFKGDYNILTNSPVLSDATGDLGDYYRCTTAGTRNFGSGNITVGVNDIIEHDGVKWFKAVNNNQSPDLSGYVSNTRTITIDGITYDLSANRTFTTKRQVIKAFYPSWNLTNLNTWRSWTRNTSNILSLDATMSMGTGSTPTGAGTTNQFADANFLLIKDCTKLNKLMFSCRETSTGSSITIQLYVASFNLDQDRGFETNNQVLINESFTKASSTGNWIKSDFTIATHTLNADSGIVIAYRITSATGVTIQGVQLNFELE